MSVHNRIQEFFNFTQEIVLADNKAPARNIFIVDPGGGEMRVQMGDGSVQHLTRLTSGYVEPSPANYAKILPTLKDAAAQVWQLDASISSYVDETADFNNATVNDVNFPATEAAGDQIIIGSLVPFNHLEIVLGTSGTVGTMLTRFWNGTAWTTVSGLVDGTVNLTAAPGTYQMTWTMPNTWATKTENAVGPFYYAALEVATLYTVNPLITQGFIVFDTDIAHIRVGW